jgi:hypothetical protein
MIERDFYWINPQSVVIPKGKLQEKINRLPFKGITDNRLRKKKTNENERISALHFHSLFSFLMTACVEPSLSRFLSS